MLFGGDFQSEVYENGGKVDTKLSIAEVEKIAKATANAIGSNFSVTKGSVDTGTFDLDFKGEKYGGGSYLIMENGDVVNVALRGRPIYYNYKTKKKLEFGGDFQAGVYENGGYFDGAIPKTSTYMTNFAMGGSLQAHGIKEGDTFLTTISGVIQKVKDKNGKIVYINLANGERDTQPPLPFDDGGFMADIYVKGGSVEDRIKKLEDKKSDLESKLFEAKLKTNEKWNNIGFGSGMRRSKLNLSTSREDSLKERIKVIEEEIYETKKTLLPFDDGGEVKYYLNKDGIRVRSKAMPEKKLTEAEWMAKHNASKEARTYGLGGLFGRTMTRPKRIDLDEKQVKLKSGEYVQVLSHEGNSLMVIELSKLGTGAKPRMVKLSDVDMTSFANGGALIGNQKRIDMNKNGKIDAEDFKLLRASMNGAWRNERKHVNHDEDYEVRYAKKKPSRTGYKGKRKFGEGGGISKFERLSRVVAKNYEGKRVKPQYQKDYGKVYSKSEAKEVGNKVAGKIKMMKKAESGAEVKKSNKGGVMVLAKQIRKEGESWKDALKRAGQQLK